MLNTVYDEDDEGYQMDSSLFFFLVERLSD